MTEPTEGITTGHQISSLETLRELHINGNVIVCSLNLTSLVRHHTIVFTLMNLWLMQTKGIAKLKCHCVEGRFHSACLYPTFSLHSVNPLISLKKGRWGERHYICTTLCINAKYINLLSAFTKYSKSLEKLKHSKLLTSNFATIVFYLLFVSMCGLWAYTYIDFKF